MYVNTQNFLPSNKILHTLGIIVLPPERGPAFLEEQRLSSSGVHSRVGSLMSNRYGHDGEDILLFAITFPPGEHDSVIFLAQGRE